MEVGVDGIVVSNHGARQLDYTPASITVLEEVAMSFGLIVFDIDMLTYWSLLYPSSSNMLESIDFASELALIKLRS